MKYFKTIIPRRKATKNYISCQALIPSLIHKYINGRLVEKDKILINK